jgi:hypothetical protein
MRRRERALACFPLLPLAGEGAQRADEGVSVKPLGLQHSETPIVEKLTSVRVLFTDTFIRPVGHLLPQAGEGENWGEVYSRDEGNGVSP